MDLENKKTRRLLLGVPLILVVISFFGEFFFRPMNSNFDFFLYSYHFWAIALVVLSLILMRHDIKKRKEDI